MVKVATVPSARQTKQGLNSRAQVFVLIAYVWSHHMAVFQRGTHALERVLNKRFETN